MNFDWGMNSPGAGVPADGFSARWSGQVPPLYMESYTSFTQSDDGTNWTDHASTEDRGAVTLTAGQKYDLSLVYYERMGNAVAKLSWASARQTKQIIPASQLFLKTGLPKPPVTPPSAPTDLDPSGKVIPDSTSPIPQAPSSSPPTAVTAMAARSLRR